MKTTALALILMLRSWRPCRPRPEVGVAVILLLAFGTWGRGVRCRAVRGSYSETATCRWRRFA